MRQITLCYRCALIFKIGTPAIRRRKAETTPTLFVVMVTLTTLTIYSTNFNEALGQVQERARWLLPDVARVTLNSSGKPQIDFNPTICRRLGPNLCEYFRAHEYGHVNLRHLERGVPTRQAEREADIWAANNASPAAVAAARKYFENGNGGSRFHGSAKERAQRIKDAQRANRLVNATQKRMTYLKPRVSSTTTSITTRVPIQYSGGSRVTVVRKPVPQNMERVVNFERSTSNASSQHYTRRYVPKGGFNNPSR